MKVKLYARWILIRHQEDDIYVLKHIKRFRRKKVQYHIVPLGAAIKDDEDIILPKILIMNFNFTRRNIFINISKKPNNPLFTKSIVSISVLRLTNKIIYYLWLHLIYKIIPRFFKGKQPQLIIQFTGRRLNYRFLIKRFLLHIAKASSRFLNIIQFRRYLKNPHGFVRLRKWPRRKRRLQRRSK